jgi:hypothetical protein
MSYHCGQFRDFCKRMLISQDEELATPAAINLLLGTCAQESQFGHYLRQKGKGPALGAFQMEPATFKDLRLKYSFRYMDIKEREPYELEYDVRLAVIMARLKYRSIKQPLPNADDVPELAAYWKQWYNTPLGAGTVEEFIANYEKYVTE